MPQFRKKPVVIEARQFTGGKGHKALVAWVNSHRTSGEPVRVIWDGRNVAALIINTLEGDHWATPGDWIINGVQGEFYPCKPDIFDATYEPAE